MSMSVPATSRRGLERSCGRRPADWIRQAPSRPGVEGIEAFFTGHAYDPHRHDTYAIGYTLSGVQCFEYRGAQMSSLPGNAIVIHPDERHDGHAGSADGFCYRMLYIEPRLIRDALGTRAKTLPFVPTAVCSDRHLVAALRAAMDEWEHGWEALEIDQIILAIADALLALDRSAQVHARPGINSAALETTRQYLEENFDRVVSSEELEELTGLDRYGLARQFRSHFGTSPYRYLTMRRLDRARQAIEQGQCLADAAAASGFADQSHMTRQFKKAYGVSPGRWQMLREIQRHT